MINKQNKEIVDFIKKLSVSSNYYDRMNCVIILGMIKSSQITKFTVDEDHRVRSSVVHWLAINKRYDDLISMLNDKEWRIRRLVVEKLSKVPLNFADHLESRIVL